MSRASCFTIASTAAGSFMVPLTFRPLGPSSPLRRQLNAGELLLSRDPPAIRPTVACRGLASRPDTAAAWHAGRIRPSCYFPNPPREADTVTISWRTVRPAWDRRPLSSGPRCCAPPARVLPRVGLFPTVFEDCSWRTIGLLDPLARPLAGRLLEILRALLLSEWRSWPRRRCPSEHRNQLRPW